MEIMLLDIISIEAIIELLVILLFSFVGSFAKNYLNIIQNPSIPKINIEVILSTFTATIIIFTFSEYIKIIFAFKAVLLFSFMAGLVGFELLTTLSSIKGLIYVIDTCFSFYMKASRTLRDEDDENEINHHHDNTTFHNE